MLTPDSVAVDRTKEDKWRARRPSVVITYPFPLGEPSGGSRMTREIARHLGKLGADVKILPVSTNGLDRGFPRSQPENQKLGFEFDRVLLQDSVEILRIPQNPFYIQLDGISVKRALTKLVQQQKPDIVLSYYHEGAFLPSYLKSLNIKFGYIATWITYERIGQKRPRNIPGLLQSWKNRRLIVKPYRQADIIFATSQHTRSQLVDIVGVDEHRVAVCYLGVDPAFNEIPRAQPKEITRLLFFGRVVPAKGFVDALEALGQLAAKGLHDWTFRIVGEGRHDRVQKAAQKYGIADKVIVCDAVDDRGLRRELMQAHLVVMPSHREAFGLTFAEAQAAGVPVVAYEAGSVPEVVEDGVTGWLAPLGDVEGLAQRIENAMRDPETTYRAGLAGRERVKRMFTWEKTVQTILDRI